VLAGDIGSHTRGLEWASRRFAKQPIVYVAGNHEFKSGFHACRRYPGRTGAL
jgi:hypothetical protein